MEYLLVNSEGKILAVLQRGAEVARELARIERDSPTERVIVVRHDESVGDLASTESFVTVRPMSSPFERPQPRSAGVSSLGER